MQSFRQHLTYKIWVVDCLPQGNRAVERHTLKMGVLVLQPATTHKSNSIQESTKVSRENTVNSSLN